MARMPQYQGDFRRFDPRRRPEWRWLIAQRHADDRTRPKKWEDAAIGVPYRYLILRNKFGFAGAREKCPAMAAAHEVYVGGAIVKDEIEARLLAGESVSAIAAKTNIPAATIVAYESAFFDVSRCLHAHDWLLLQVVQIVPGVPVTEGQIWKYLALAAGTIFVDVMIADHLHRPIPNLPDRCTLAARGRYVVRSYATNWNDLTKVRKIIKEGCKLFPHLVRGGSTREEKMLAVHIQFLRMFAGLPRLPQHADDESGDRANDEQPVSFDQGEGLFRDSVRRLAWSNWSSDPVLAVA